MIERVRDKGREGRREKDEGPHLSDPVHPQVNEFQVFVGLKGFADSNGARHINVLEMRERNKI